MATSIPIHPEEDDELPQSESAETEQDEAAESSDPLEGREDLQQALYRLYLKCCSEDRYPRMMEIKDVQQACMYWRSLQYLWWSQSNESWNFPNQQHGMQLAPIDVDDMPRFEFVTNIYQAFGLSLISAMAQSPPRVRWFPDDAENPADVEQADGFKKLSKIIERWNPIAVQMQDEVYHLWTGGVIGEWTRYIADGERYGFEQVDDLDEEEVPGSDQVRCASCGFTAPLEELPIPTSCPGCSAPLTEDNIAPGQSASVPTSAGESQVPKGRQTITVVGALNLKRPQYAREQSEFHYLSFEEEIHYAKLRAAHPEKGKKIKPGATIGEDNGYERNARLAVMQGAPTEMQTGEAQSVLTTYARVWFRPTAFYSDAVKDEDRDELLDIFPRGCRVNFAGSEYCESEEQSMDDCWAVQHAMPGDGQHRPALGSTMISVQDRFNTFTNIMAETYEYGIPITYRAADTWDAEASDEQRSEPGAEVDVQVPAGGDIRNRIMQLRNDSVSPDMMKHTMDLMGPVSQFLTGAFPALMGAGGAQAAAGDTATGYKMQMEQALGRCGISYVRLKQLHADMQTLSCKDYCAHASGTTKMSVLGDSGDFETESVDVDALEGDAKAYPEGDENFPVLWTQQRAFFMEIMGSAQGPALMTEPDNAELATQLIGIEGLVIPGADARKKAMRVIGLLTKIPEPGQSPMLEPPMPGAPPQVAMSPQIPPPIDPDVDTPIASALAETCLRWLNGDNGYKCSTENQQGYQNVKQYMLAAKSLIPPPTPPAKPLSESLTGKLDLPPAAQIQILKQWGINVAPQDFIDAAALEKAKRPTPAIPAPGAGPQSAANPGPSGPGATA